MESLVVKKFYRDLTEEEQAYLSSVLEEMREAPIFFPPHVIKRMIDRGIITRGLVEFDEDDEIVNYSVLNAIPGYQNSIRAFDEGVVYEMSNEGLGRPGNPFRVVIAYEHSDGFTYFVKIAPISNIDPENDEVKILDVWRKMGKMPIYPPKHSISQFVVDWDIVETLEAYFYDSKDESKSFFAVSA